MAREMSAERRSRLIAVNRQEYGERYGQLHFATAREAQQAARCRDDLLAAMAGQIESHCGGSKLASGSLSPGCRICTEGGWSCLFISGRCNCRCFYCPTSQEKTGIPTTNTVPFSSPADYVAYLEHFGFSGASISGGEPLLTPEHTLAFVAAIKKRFGAALHLWLYTNGTLVEEGILGRLRDAGLDEIRFDIGATGYRLDRLRRAVGVIPIVTVEIPAVPEDLFLLEELMVEMREAGVDHLNLHQLRLTPFNLPQLVSRGYTFLHGEKVTVLDSELAALELLHFAVERRLDLPVNYCSFVYKNRYQGLAARRRNALFVGKGYEALTANGYLRTLTLLGPAEAIDRQAEVFRAGGAPPELWSCGSSRERLLVSPVLWPSIDFTPFRLLVGYASCRQLSGVSYRNPFSSVKLATGRKIIVERDRAAADFELAGGQIPLFSSLFLQPGALPVPPEEVFVDLAPFERPSKGLAVYF